MFTVKFLLNEYEITRNVTTYRLSHDLPTKIDWMTDRNWSQHNPNTSSPSSRDKHPLFGYGRVFVGTVRSPRDLPDHPRKKRIRRVASPQAHLPVRQDAQDRLVSGTRDFTCDHRFWCKTYIHFTKKSNRFKLWSNRYSRIDWWIWWMLIASAAFCTCNDYQSQLNKFWRDTRSGYEWLSTGLHLVSSD